MNIPALQAVFAAATGVPVVWKSATGSAPLEADALAASHENPYCLAVKASRKRFALCTQDCVDSIHNKFCTHDTGVRKHCHGGCIESVVPIWYQGEFRGALFWGPFRPPKQSSPYGGLNHYYAALPEFTHERLRAGNELLALAVGAAEQTYVPGGTMDLDNRIARISAHIMANLENDLSVTTLARLVHMSGSRLQHLFSYQRGMPLRDYIASCRVKRAVDLIATTELPLTEIARRVGMENYAWFSTFIRQKTGKAPSMHRSRNHLPPQP